MGLSSWKQNNYNRTESPCIFLSTKMVDLFPFFMCLLLKEKKRQNMKCMKLTQPRWLSRVKHAKMLKSLFISLAAHCQLLCRNKGPQAHPLYAAIQPLQVPYVFALAISNHQAYFLSSPTYKGRREGWVGEVLNKMTFFLIKRNTEF